MLWNTEWHFCRADPFEASSGSFHDPTHNLLSIVSKKQNKTGINRQTKKIIFVLEETALSHLTWLTCSVRRLLSSVWIQALRVSSVMKICAALANSTGASALIIYGRLPKQINTGEIKRTTYNPIQTLTTPVPSMFRPGLRQVDTQCPKRLRQDLTQGLVHVTAPELLIALAFLSSHSKLQVILSIWTSPWPDACFPRG